MFPQLSNAYRRIRLQCNVDGEITSILRAFARDEPAEEGLEKEIAVTSVLHTGDAGDRERPRAQSA